MIVVDTSAILAYMNSADTHHAEVSAWLADEQDDLATTPLIVAEVGRTIQRLKEDGQSIVLVEQNIQLALDVADQAVILNTGRCVFAGTAGDILKNEDLIAQNLGVVHGH